MTNPQIELSSWDAPRAFEAGWRTAANWAHRNDLLADIGSPAYLADRAKALAQHPEQQPTGEKQ